MVSSLSEQPGESTHMESQNVPSKVVETEDTEKLYNKKRFRCGCTPWSITNFSNILQFWGKKKGTGTHSGLLTINWAHSPFYVSL